jgi:hypothetical protein
MSYIYFGNLQASVPPTLGIFYVLNSRHDPLHASDVVVRGLRSWVQNSFTFSTNSKQYELLHPSWPSVWPRMLTDGKIIVYCKFVCVRTLAKSPTNKRLLIHTFCNLLYCRFSLRPLTKKKKQYLWECEQERFVFKACLRTLIGLKRTPKHTSWDTAPISNITITWSLLSMHIKKIA